MIDGGVFFGRNPSTGLSFDEKTLLRHLDGHGFSAAVVSSYESVFSDVKEGNAALAALARRHPSRVIAAATLAPAAYDAYRDPAYLASLKNDGVKLLSVLAAPKYYDVRFDSPSLFEALREADNMGFAVQLGVEGPADLAAAAAHLGFFEGAVLVRFVRGRAYHAFADVLALAKRRPNWLFDAGSLTTSGAIAALVERVGAERVYLATNAPESISGASVCLAGSALSGAARDAVFGGTLAKALGLPKAKPFDDKAWEKLYGALVRREKIDTHWHTGGWNLIEPEKDEKLFPTAFDRFGIHRAVVSSIRALNGALEEGNREAFAFAKKEPRAAALVVVDPTRPNETAAEIARYAKDPACAGLKTIQDLYGLSLDAPEYEPVLREAAARDLTVMAHIPGLGKAAAKHKTVRFVCAHATHGRVRPLYGAKNVWFDVATSHADAAETRFDLLVSGAGEDRVIFASDAQLMSPAWTIGKIASFEFPEKTLEKIFAKNALDAFPKLKGI